MAGGEGFAGGVTMGLQMFNAMQNASYMQSLTQQHQQNMQMRREELEVNKARFQFEQDKQDTIMNDYVLAHPEAFGQDVRLAALNKQSRKLAGPNARQLNQLDVDAFEADLRGFPAKLAGANDRQQQLSLMTEMQSKASQNPMFLQAFQRRMPVFQQVVEQQGYYDTAKATFGELMDEKELSNWVRRTDPKIIAKTFEDKDFQKMFVMRQVENNLQQFHTGEVRFSDAKLRDTLAMGRAVGMEMGPKAENLLKTHDTYSMYNRSAESLTEAKQRYGNLFQAIDFAPDAGAIANLKVEKPNVSAERYAGGRTKDGTPFGPLAYFAADVQAATMEDTQHKAFLDKNPRIAQALQDVVPEAYERVSAYQDRLKDLASKRDLMKRDRTNPNRDMMLNLYDREEEAIKREMAPYKVVADYGQNPGLPTLQKVIRLKGSLNKSLQEVSQLRDTALTASERIATHEADRKFDEANSIKGTNYVQMKLNQYAAENPDADEATLRGKSAEFANEAKGMFGNVLPDSNKALDTFITKRTSTQILSSEERKSVSESEANMITGESLLNEFKPEYVGPADNFMNKILSKLPEGSPEFLKLSGEHQAFRQRAELFLTQYRNKMFGASLSSNEEKSALSAMANLGMGDDQFKASLKEMIKWDKIMTERIKANAGKFGSVRKKTADTTQAGPQPQEQISKAPVDEAKSVQAYHEWKKKNPSGTPAQFFGE